MTSEILAYKKEVIKKIENFILNKKNQIRIDLKNGVNSARYWTCDLSEEYVRINAAYST